MLRVRVAGLLPALLALLAGCASGDSTSSPGPVASPAPTTSGWPLSSLSAAPVSAEPKPVALRIYKNPYADVSWAVDVRLKAQHHDHVGTSRTKVRAYDAAGYHVLALLDYSGNPALSQSLRKRLWPVQSVFPADFTGTLASIRVFLPAAEEVGFATQHITSPFMTRYIERWDPSTGAKRPHEYETPSDLRKLITDQGGVAILAHPWYDQVDRDWIADFDAMEIYSALAEMQRRIGLDPYYRTDRNARLISAWDSALAKNPALIGVAVNDHFGPDYTRDLEVGDSGKIVVMARDHTLDAYRAAFQSGAVLAVRDMGRVKDRYSHVRFISAEDKRVTLVTDGDVTWISMGQVFGTGKRFDLSVLPIAATYLRAEIRNTEGSVVYTQAFTLGTVGDADGDRDHDEVDRRICLDVASGAERNPVLVAACRST